MKIKVIGLERREGVSKKTGKPYQMGTIHALVALDEGEGPDYLIKGYAGTVYERVPMEVVASVDQLPLPFDADIVIQDFMRFGNRESRIVGIRPVLSKPASQPAKQVA